MIPILFPANETAFTSNGIGRLSSATECTVTEERNGEYELYMEYPVTGQYFDELKQSRIIYAVPADGKGPQPFRIYRIEKPLDGICSVYAEHVSYQLNYIPVMPFTATTPASALQGLVTNAAENCPFTVWTDKTGTGNFTLKIPQSFRQTLGGVQGSILDVFGKGEYEFDKYLVRLWLNRGSDTGVTIRYGKNLVDLKQDENIENTYTGVLPYWANNETGAIVTLPEKVIWSDNAGNFPYKRTKVIDFTDQFGEQPTVAQLRAATQSYIEANDIGVPSVSLDVEFVALWQMSGAGMEDYRALERVNLCDTITVVFDRLGVSAKAKVIRTVYNVLKDRYDSIEIGDAKTNLSDIITETAAMAVEVANDDQISTLQRYVDHQTALITGGLGGYVYLTPNANGEPQEILIMDTDDVDTAVNVIRMNRNGIGFSYNGYSGPYRSAWTIDGVFNTALIGAGSITAAMLAAEVLTAGNISLYGKMAVYTDSTLGTAGGHIGYMTGSDGSSSTNGIAIMSGSNHFIATDNGVRMTSVVNGVYHSAYISGAGSGNFVTSSGTSIISNGTANRLAGTVRLNYNGSSYSGITYCNEVRLPNNSAISAQTADGSGSFWLVYSDSNNATYLGNTAYATVLRGTSVYLQNVGGTAVASDARKKNTIESLPRQYATFFDGLRPVRFKYNDGKSGRYHVGFIAQEVKEALNSAGLDTSDFAGYVDVDGTGELGLIYTELIALNTQMIKDMKTEISGLKSEIDALRNEIKNIKEDSQNG